MDNTFEAPRGRLLPTLVAFVFALALLYTFYLVFERYHLNGVIADLQDQQKKVQNQMEVLKDQQVAEVFVAQELKNKVEESEVRWSTVVTRLDQLTPVGVFLSSYAIGQGGEIQVTGVGDGFSSVADLIAALTSSDDFAKTFVPSVTKGTTSDGQTVASFTLETYFVAP